MIDTGDATVQIEQLNHFFGDGENRKQVLFDINLELMPGQIVLLTGPSGSGKTTLLTLVGTLRQVQEGKLFALGREYQALSQADIVKARREIGFVFQAHNLFESLTALRNVLLALELGAYTKKQRRDLAKDILQRVGLGERLTYKPAKLSGGQRQRVAVARALVNRPKLILADEPTAALDEESGKDVMELLRQLADEEGATVLVVTHDNRILEYADRLVNMIDGRIASDVLVNQSIEICNFLRKCSIFEAMSPNQLTEVSQKMTVEEFSAGDTIIRQGDEGDKFYILRSGTADVVSDNNGDSRIVHSLVSGDHFGDTALLTGEPRNATIIATSDVQVYALDKASFEMALNACQSFADQLREVFFQRR